MAEQLENRLLLTTLTLQGADPGIPLASQFVQDTVFIYADPQELDPGDDVDVFNEIRIGTLSGLPPLKDVVVEVLNFRGNDIPGTLFENGQTTSIGGGPGSLQLIEEVGDTFIGSLSALATDPNGRTFGIVESGFREGDLFEIFPSQVGAFGNVVVNFIAEVQDRDNPAALGNTVFFTEFEAADFDPISGTLYAIANGPIAFDGTGAGISFGEVLITIDLVTGEAEAVGKNDAGQADYSFSEVGGFLLGDRYYHDCLQPGSGGQQHLVREFRQ
ncbi:MAG: hypothetical protein IID32_11320 [Planctomycetes bacterium]|nr:hypothetical protein [Planctomycetota bacterium]